MRTTGRLFFASGAYLKKNGPVRELNPGPLAPEARIIPLDQQASCRERVSKTILGTKFCHKELQTRHDKNLVVGTNTLLVGFGFSLSAVKAFRLPRSLRPMSVRHLFRLEPYAQTIEAANRSDISIICTASMTMADQSWHKFPTNRVARIKRSGLSGS